MTLEELHNLLLTTELPVAYLAFPADQAAQMPFIVYQETGSNNTGADNIVWHSARHIQIDLLTRKRDLVTETLLESVLNGAGLFWERVPDYDSDEDYYRVTYEIEV